MGAQSLDIEMSVMGRGKQVVKVIVKVILVGILVVGRQLADMVQPSEEVHRGAQITRWGILENFCGGLKLQVFFQLGDECSSSLRVKGDRLHAFMH